MRLAEAASGATLFGQVPYIPESRKVVYTNVVGKALVETGNSTPFSDFALERRLRMPAPMGTWNFFTSGAATPGTLILSASTTSTITGTLQTGSSAVLPITAVWDETSQILSISRATAAGSGANDTGFTVEVYVGTLFQGYATPNGSPSPDGVPLMLAGNFGTATAGGSVGPFNQSGWFAKNTIKFKEKEGKESKDSKDVSKDGKEHKDTSKEHKDGKERAKEAIKEDLLEKLPEVAFSPVDAASAMAADGGAGAEVRIATGKSFISSEERPQLGGTALQS